MEDTRQQLQKLHQCLSSVIRGKEDTIELLLVSLLSGGNVLLHDVPGVGKTTLAKSLAACLAASFHRLQFTPDLLPTDILGGDVYNPRDGEMHFRPGPVFANILLADEINRASPRTQSALLEAMSEGQVSTTGGTVPLPRPFLLLATENPVEFQGTYALPEAQLDRFAMRLTLGYPDFDAERQLVLDRLSGEPLADLAPCLNCQDILDLQGKVRQVKVEESLLAYILEIVRATRQDDRLVLGGSPRSILQLTRCSQGLAWFQGRDYVLPDDIKRLAVPVLAHRLVLDTQASYSGEEAGQVVKDILGKLPVPR